MGVARAAASTGIPIAMSNVCSVPLQTLFARSNPDTWFQLYMLDGREGARMPWTSHEQAGCRVLVVTVDVAGVAPSDRIHPSVFRAP